MIRVEKPHLFVTAATHPGMKGKNNEDRYKVTAYRIDSLEGVASLFLIISDGIGGHRAGEVAADMAVDMITHTVGDSNGQQPLEILRYAIAGASQAIREESEKDSARHGMGATCVCAWIIGEKLYAGSVGDSRLYLVRDDAIRQLTVDHTWIQEALEYGALSPDQVANHPNAHVIRRYLGSENPAMPDFRLRLSDNEKDSHAETNQGMALQPGDRLMLCSDGLTDLTNADEILTVLQALPREKAVTELINMANIRGGHDNITIILAEVPPRPPAASEPQNSRPKAISWPVVLGCLAGVWVLMCLVATMIGGWWWITQQGR